jgi:phosphate uptake regulator
VGLARGGWRLPAVCESVMDVQKALITSVHDLESRVSKLEKAVIALYEWLNHASADECKNACKEIYS